MRLGDGDYGVGGDLGVVRVGRMESAWNGEGLGLGIGFGYSYGEEVVEIGVFRGD